MWQPENRFDYNLVFSIFYLCVAIKAFSFTVELILSLILLVCALKENSFKFADRKLLYYRTKKNINHVCVSIYFSGTFGVPCPVVHTF